METLLADLFKPFCLEAATSVAEVSRCEHFIFSGLVAVCHCGHLGLPEEGVGPGFKRHPVRPGGEGLPAVVKRGVSCAKVDGYEAVRAARREGVRDCLLCARSAPLWPRALASVSPPFFGTAPLYSSAMVSSDKSARKHVGFAVALLACLLAWMCMCICTFIVTARLKTLSFV